MLGELNWLSDHWVLTIFLALIAGGIVRNISVAVIAAIKGS